MTKQRTKQSEVSQKKNIFGMHPQAAGLSCVTKCSENSDNESCLNYLYG